MAVPLSRRCVSLLALPLAVLLCSASIAESVRCRDYNPLRTAWFGDLHVHTSLSLDAAVQGTRTDPLDAYRFAQGQEIPVPPYTEYGLATKRAGLERPIDFAAVTDHAETLGELRICSSPDLPGYNALACRGLRWFPHLFGLYMTYRAANSEWVGYCGEDGELCIDAAREPWDAIRAAAELAYDRSSECRFTSFVAYEWTGAAFPSFGRKANLHRNIIFANAAVPEYPISFINADSPTELYDELDRQCADAGIGCEAIAIPHNGNLSLGAMFGEEGGEDPKQRARYEKLVEIMQHKGASECYFSADTALAVDELCNFEQLPWGSFTGNILEFMAQPPEPDAGYARGVLKRGLELGVSTGVNPFQFGFVGSTDSHRSLAGGTDEARFEGHGGAGNREAEVGSKGLPDEWEFNPGGLAVLYAEQNTRESLFAAMKRREAYATSGPRLQVRFFGGHSLPEKLCEQNDFIDQGYRRGVPMGGTLEHSAEPLRFAVLAMKDPGTEGQPGTDLQRVQIVKAWVDDEGLSREQVYDVAGDANSQAGVDLATCQPMAPGYRKLCTVWQDPDFEAGRPAVYYARVLENPSCRWTTRVCNRQQISCEDPAGLSEVERACCAPELSRSIQERAWTSPIWYAPEDAPSVPAAS